jgi:hypothetical protein
VKTSLKRSFATACVSTDQKVRGSNPFARTRQKSWSTTPDKQFPGVCCAVNNQQVSNPVSHLVLKPVRVSFYTWRVRLNFNGGICLTIVYQHDLTSVMLILDIASQDLVLGGSSIGIEISLLSGRGMLLTVDVSLEPESSIKDAKNQIHKRRWNASDSGVGDRAIHQKNFQRNHDWGRELNNGK